MYWLVFGTKPHQKSKTFQVVWRVFLWAWLLKMWTVQKICFQRSSVMIRTYNSLWCSNRKRKSSWWLSFSLACIFLIIPINTNYQIQHTLILTHAFFFIRLPLAALLVLLVLLAPISAAVKAVGTVFLFARSWFCSKFSYAQHLALSFVCY